jgi:type IV secretory pathway VirB4 component
MTIQTAEVVLIRMQFHQAAGSKVRPVLVFRNRLKDWLKTMRRRNAVLVMATQQISDIANSQIADVVSENCPTKILLPNASIVLIPLYYARFSRA